MSDSSVIVHCVVCCEQAIIHGSFLLLTYHNSVQMPGDSLTRRSLFLMSTVYD